MNRSNARMGDNLTQGDPLRKDRSAAPYPFRELLIALALVCGGPRLAALLRGRIGG